MGIRSKLLGAGVAAVAFGLLSTSAMATTTVTASVGGAPTGAILDNLDALTQTNSPQFSSTLITVTVAPGAYVATGSLGGVYAAPYLSGGNGNGFGPGSSNQANGADATPYLAAEPGANITLDFGQELHYVGLLWGSIDGYNSLALYDGSTLVDTITGAEAAAAALTLPNGDQSVGGTAYVNINSTVQFDTIVAISGSPAFEFDNIAYNVQQCDTNDCTQSTNVPEPITLSLFGAGIAGLAGLRFRRKKSS